MPEILVRGDYLTNSFHPLSNPISDDNKVVPIQSYIPNVGRLRFDSRFSFPLIKKDHKVRILKAINFPPIFCAKTPRKRLSFQLLEKVVISEVKLRTIHFCVKIYPFGLGVIDFQLNFNGIINKEQLNLTRKSLSCGKKQSSLQQYVNFLKFQVIKSLILEEKLEEVQTVLIGPKIRVDIVADDVSLEEFKKISLDLLIPGRNEPKLIKGREEGDKFSFYKTGIVSYVPIGPLREKSKTRRKYLRNNFDLIMDLVFGTEVLLPVLPTFITKSDLQNFSINRAYNSALISLNPKILASRKEIESLLPTALLKKWYLDLSSSVKLWDKFLEEAAKLVNRLPELRIDRWLEVVNTFILSDIPEIRQLIKNTLSESKFDVRDILSLKPSLKGKELAIFDFLLNRLENELIRRFGFESNSFLDEEQLGFCTVSEIADNVNMKGRKQAEVKRAVEMMLRVGLLQSKPYHGPGSRKGSKRYRASLSHPFINARLKTTLSNHFISSTNIDLI